MPIFNHGDSKPKRTLARTFRKAPPLTERLLWRLLRDRRLTSVKFRRQVPIGPYVADFLCFDRRLIVEADGPHHDPEKDGARDAWFRAQGFRTLRFTNAEVQTNAYAVLDKIEAALERRPQIPSPLAGEGGPKGVG